MSKNSTTEAAGLFAGEAWFDPIEAALRERVRGFLEELVEQEATAALGRGRYQGSFNFRARRDDAMWTARSAMRPAGG